MIFKSVPTAPAGTGCSTMIFFMIFLMRRLMRRFMKRFMRRRMKFQEKCHKKFHATSHETSHETFREKKYHETRALSVRFLMIRRMNRPIKFCQLIFDWLSESFQRSPHFITVPRSRMACTWCDEDIETLANFYRENQPLWHSNHPTNQ